MADVKSLSVARVVVPVLFAIAWPALVLLLAWDAAWVEGWLFAVWFVGLYATVTVWMYVKDPALLAERRRRAPKEASAAERRDRGLVLLLFVAFTAWFVLIPLDARRFGWTPGWTPGVKALGGILLLASAFFLFRAFHDNTFLSGVTRVQSDRKQRVVSTGVYAVVRHPMYLGMVLMAVGGPLLLGSRVGLLPAAIVAAVLIVRIRREERLLEEELEGYADYRRRVRYRLIPLVW